jgi:transcriptional regulator with XRE-family HTH domain
MLEYTHMQTDSTGEVSKDLAEKIKTAREKLGLTQADVAKKAGMTVNYYAMIERGEVNLSSKKIDGILKALNLKVKFY